MAQMWLLAGGSLGLRCPSIVMQAQDTNAEIARLLRQQNDEMQTRLNGLVVSTGAPSQFAAAPLSGGLVTNRARLTLPLAVGGAAVAGAAATFFLNKPDAAAPDAPIVKEFVADIRAGSAASEAARAKVVSELAEAATDTYFPGHMSGGAVDEAVFKVLSKRGYTPQNTLYGASVCPDEVNHGPGDVQERMKARWGEGFYLGGLAGVPFVGSAGFTAYSHHSPTDGKLLVLFAPHIGISADGAVGKLSRVGQLDHISKACGATIGSLGAVAKRAQAAALGESAPPPPPASSLADRMRNEQLGLIIDQLEKRMADQPKTGKGSNEIAYATYMMYETIREQFIEQFIAAGDTVWDDATEITVLGGIMINRAEGGDRFLPLNLESRTKAKGETTVDLYTEAFGPRGDLSGALGSYQKSMKMFMPYNLDKLAEDGSAMPLA